MKDPFTIPIERLPPGFAEHIERPPVPPAEPRPAATAVLVREGSAAPEVLLLKRHRSSGFVPGAYVFPGGRVDAADAEVRWPAGTWDPPPEYWVAVVREVFEETGVLLARTTTGEWSADAANSTVVREWRERLMQEEAAIGDVIRALAVTIDAIALCYIAHWITPIAEPRRYDTRFFVAQLPAGQTALADPREMTDAIWLSAREALARFGQGMLPMVFPTVKTLETLAPYERVSEIFESFRDRVIEPVLPRLVRSDAGVGIVIDQEKR